MYTTTTEASAATRAAMRAAVGLKQLRIPSALWNQIRRGLLRIVCIPRAVATGGLALLSTTVGYTFLVKAAGVLVRAAATVVRQVTRLVTTPLRWLGRGVTRLVGLVSPKAERTLRTATAKVLAPVCRVVAWTGTMLRTVGQTVEALAHAPLVRRTATTTAAVGGAVVAAPGLGGGAVAAKAASLMPHAARLLAFLANPWVALGVVAAATLGAMGITLARPVRTLRQEDAPSPAPLADPEPGAEPADEQPDQPTATEPPAEARTADRPAPTSTGPVFTGKDATGMALAARSLHVHVDRDDAVTVDGIPGTLPGHVAEHVARVAADAAVAQLQRLQALRPTLSRDDRRLIVKVAREAVAAEAKRLASGQQPLQFAA